MGVDFKALVGYGYIVSDKQRDDLIDLCSKYEDDFKPIDGYDENTDWFFGEVFSTYEPGEYDILSSNIVPHGFNPEEVEEKMFTMLSLRKLPNDFADLLHANARLYIINTVS